MGQAEIMQVLLDVYEPGNANTDAANLISSPVVVDSAASSDEELVSCLMVTRGDPKFIESAVKSFKLQSYSNKELIIIYDTSSVGVENLAREIGGDDIRFIHANRMQWLKEAFRSLVHGSLRGRLGRMRGLARAAWARPRLKLPLGLLRNIAVAQAKGNIVCQWDDDDLHHRDRLAVQVRALYGGRVSAVFLKRWLIWLPAQQLFSISGPRIWEGSLLAWKKGLPRYQPIRRAEDTLFVDALCKTNRIGLLDIPHLYCYTIHGNNT